MDIKKDFGLRIKEIRTKKGITQYQLAEKAGIDPKHMSHIETGRSFPKADLIERFANALDVEYNEFFNNKHLKSRTEIIEKLHSIIYSMSDKDLQNFYKIAMSIYN